MVSFDIQNDILLYRRVIRAEGFPQLPDRAFVGNGAVEAETVRAALGSRQPAAFLVLLAAAAGAGCISFSRQTVVLSVFSRDFAYKLVASRLAPFLSR